MDVLLEILFGEFCFRVRKVGFYDFWVFRFIFFVWMVLRVKGVGGMGI